jgi:hypothetical protein
MHGSQTFFDSCPDSDYEVVFFRNFVSAERAKWPGIFVIHPFAGKMTEEQIG